MTEKDAMEALGLLGLNVADFITNRYERGGYHVIGIAPAKPKRVAEIDLCQLWEQSASAAPEALFCVFEQMWDISRRFSDILDAEFARMRAEGISQRTGGRS